MFSDDAPPRVESGDAGIGAVIAQVGEDAKGYAAAQVALYRETFAMRLRVGKSGLVLAVVAVLLALAAIPALLVGLILSLTPQVGPLGATLIVVLATLAVAALCGWLGSRIIARMFEPIA